MTDGRPVDPHTTVTVTRDVTNVVTLGVPGQTSGTGITPAEKDTINGRLTTLESAPASTASIVYDVRDYGAVGNGVTNDRAAIQAAINAAVAAGGGTVFFFEGIYKVQITQATTVMSPARNGQHCLVINGDNITLELAPGAIIDCYVYGGDPDTNWEVVSGSVWRGGGVYIMGGATYATRRRNVRVQGGEIRGNFTYTGDHGWPANTATGVGWDTTHKGIWYENDLYHDGHSVEWCHIHGFSGEIIYSGGADEGVTPVLGLFTVLHCDVHDTNGSAISLSGRTVTVQHNHVHTTAGNGIENVTKEGRHEISSNRIHNTLIDAVSCVGYGGSIGGFNIHNNEIYNGTLYGIGLWSAWHSQAHDNIIYDCATGGIRMEVGTGYPNDTVQHVDIFDNMIFAHTRAMGRGIGFNVSTGGAKRLRAYRNWIGQSAAAIVGGFIITEPLTINPTTEMDQIDYRDNQFVGIHGTTTLAKKDNFLLTATGNVYPVQFKPQIASLLNVSISIRVVTAATTVSIKLHDGGSLVATIQASASLAPGVYTYPMYAVRSNVARSTVSIEFNAATANQVYVTAIIREA